MRADEAIDPYDLTIRQLPEAAKAEWAARVAKTLMSKQRRVAKVLILADDEYAEPLAPLFIERAINLLRPLQGLPQSAQLPLLKECHRYLARIDAVSNLYGTFDRLNGRSKILPLREADLTWLFWTKLCEKLSEDKELWSCRRRGSMRSRSWCCAAAPD